MIGRKGLLIGGVTIVAATISGIILLKDKSTPTIITEDSLLQEYEQLLKDTETQSTKACDDSAIFSKQIKNLEERFDKLKQQKNDLIAEANADERIPPVPGSEPPENISTSETSDTVEQEEYIPRPGELPLDIDGNSTPSEETEYIPPLPGEEQPENISPSETESETDTDEWIPPLPEEEPLDFDEGTITTIQKINNIEVDISDILNTLKTKCEENEPSNNCETACKNYNNKCLSLVPNVNESMLDDGFSSCMQECKKRNEEKIQCMEDAKDCVTMSEVCGL